MQNYQDHKKRRNLLLTFNLFNRNAAKENTSEFLFKPIKEEKKNILELHFINPNILFMDQVKLQSVSRVKTA